MYSINNEQFEKIVTDSIERLPEPYNSKINNVAFFVEPEPSLEQRQKLGLRPCQSLFGLYEGIPLTQRMGQTGNLLPDKITIFKIPHEQFATNLDELKIQVANTVWHEVAHYFGLDHKRIHELENKVK